MINFIGKTKFNIGKKVSTTIVGNSSLYKDGDILDGEVTRIFDGATSPVSEISAPYPIYHVKITHKNGKPHEDEIQCGEQWLKCSAVDKFTY